MPLRKISIHLPDPEKQRRGKLGQQKKAEIKKITIAADSSVLLSQDVITTPPNSLETLGDQLNNISQTDNQSPPELMDAAQIASLKACCSKG